MIPRSTFRTTHILLVILIVIGSTFLELTLVKIKNSTAQNGGGNMAGNHKLTGDIASDSIALAISQGMPEVYGAELGVSFDAVPQSMAILQLFDPGYGAQKIALAGDELKRYTDIGLRISCEYCCGAKSIVFPDGSAACGCAHSQAMRGLAAYLIKNHGSTLSNDEILRELARWKGMFFPKQMIQKIAQALVGGTYTPDVAALVLGKELPSYGGAAGNVPLPSEINNLPSMVGGC